MSRRAGLFFGVLFVVVTGLDQGSKVWAHGLPLGSRQPVISGYWDWELAYNPGAAFSSFPGGTWLLAAIAAAALVVIGIMAARTPAGNRWKLAGLAVIGGGALGNLIDRIKDGAVTDFIRWHVHDHWWPIYNVADAALLVGAMLLLYSARHESARARARSGG